MADRVVDGMGAAARGRRHCRQRRTVPRGHRERGTVPRGRRERGTVTAEAAMVLPVVTAFCLALTWMITIGIAQIRVVDAARDAARAAARGDGRQAAVAAARGAAPAGSRVDIASANRTTTVKVSDSVVPPGWLIVPLPSVTVTAHASVRDEDDVPES